MFEFERLFVCREFRIEHGGITAEGIGFEHSARTRRLLVFGHVLTPSVVRPFSYTLRVETPISDGIGSLGPWPYTLVATRRSNRRIVLAWIPVSGVLAPGRYDAIISVENEFSTRAGFEIT